MVERAHLEAAASAGLLSPDQVEPLAAFLAARPAPDAAKALPPGEEDLRFIRNFHDVFLATGIVLLAVGLAVAVGMLSQAFGEAWASVAAFTGCAASVGALWLLAEMFAGRRRLFLPAIALCVSIALFAGVAGLIAGAHIVGLANALATSEQEVEAAAPFILFFTLTATLAAACYYLRFKLPFALGFAGACAAGSAAALVGVISAEWAQENLALIMLPCGLALFAAGVWFDARDPARATRFSDNGFWLHVAAAPLILNGVLALTASDNLMMDYYGARSDVNGDGAVAQSSAVLVNSIVTLLVVFALGFVSLLINRRALIVSALVTTGIAIGMLMNATGLGEGALIAGTLVTLGGFVLVIGAAWHSMRRALLGWVKPEGAMARIFPPESHE